jgi:FMN reductase
MRADRDAGPLIVGVGGTVRPNSSSEKALRACLAAAEAEGARTRCFGGSALLMPMYDPVDPARTVAARELVDALRQADGVIVASPGYHGSVSGLVKNALDYIEDLRDDRRVYLDGRPVGLITCALAAQGMHDRAQCIQGGSVSLRAECAGYQAHGTAVEIYAAVIAQVFDIVERVLD